VCLFCNPDRLVRPPRRLTLTLSCRLTPTHSLTPHRLTPRCLTHTLSSHSHPVVSLYHDCLGIDESIHVCIIKWDDLLFPVPKSLCPPTVLSPGPMQSLKIIRNTTPHVKALQRIPNRSLTRSTPSRKAILFSLNTFHAQEDTDDEGRVLRMLMFGKPGAGKGTLSARLVKKYDILTLSTGDLLRQHIVERSGILSSMSSFG
jgi:AAA domain